MIPLLVDLETEWRGGQNQFLLLLKGLYERGHAAELLAVRGSALAHRAHSAGICVHTVSRRAARFGTVQKIRSLLADGRIELVHVNESHALTAAWLARAHRRMPLIISRRVGYPLTQSWPARKRFHAASAIIANSQWVAEQAAASGAPKEKLRVVHEGVRIPELASPEMRSKARARWNIPPDAPLLGCVGVLSEDKGHAFVIRALEMVRREFPEARLLLAGDGPSREGLQRLARDLGLQDAVVFAGFVGEIERVYQTLDVFVFPSLFEGLGTSLLAAMSFGVPSVTFFGCALGEIVENGTSGIQVEPGKSDSIARAVCSILRDGNLAAAVGRAGRGRIERHFSAEQMVDGTIGVYREMLDA
jgi:glycosyltransferase involved in cell wall biosynthesis